MSSAGSLQTSLQRLSSGLRINSAKDDAAGLAIASRMSAQIGGLNQAIRNANDGISLAQTAEGALSTSSSMLLRMRDLAVQAANDTNSGTDRTALQQEVSQLQQEINRVATSTQFNGKNLLDGTFTAQNFQIGANANQTVAISMTSAAATAIGNNTLASTGSATTTSATAATDTGLNTVAAQTLTISGTVGSTTANVAVNSTAAAVATAVNAVSASTGVSATASTSATLTAQNTGTFTFNLYGSNSSAVAISASVVSTSDLSSLADAINGKAASTGVTATASGGTITLSSAQGYDIALENVSNGAAGTLTMTGATGAGAILGAAAGTDSSRVAGSVSFSSSSSYSVATTTTGTLFAASPNASTLSSVASINVGSQSGANSAISVIDGALGFINSQRAALGAVQNRIESTVSNLSATSENLSAARSRVQDADFAAETAALTRSQVLQQAGMAMLAQANAVPSQVLTLLRG
jgi:flagellin